MKRYLTLLLVAFSALVVIAQDTTAPDVHHSLARDSRLFEQRTYHVAPGKIELLNSRFRHETCRIFVKHNMDVIGFWVPMDKNGQYENTLIYLLAFPNLAAREKAWKEFSADPEWKAVQRESEKDGPLVEKVDKFFMTATDYSPLK